MISLPTTIQQTESHCGPAVVQRLLGFTGMELTQDVIAEAAGVAATIEDSGTRPIQMAKAVAALAPHMQMWFKNRATKQDIHRLIHEFRWPVGINWQGLFYDSVEEERDDDPYGIHGHYSVVVDIDLHQNTITIADTYKDYAEKPRTFSLTWFESRWWDAVYDMNQDTEEIETTATHHFLFAIAPKEAWFPRDIGMEMADRLPALTKRTSAIFPLTHVFHLPGQKAFIRQFVPNSEADFLAMQSIMDEAPVKQWMDNVDELSWSSYQDWVGDTSDDSFLFAVHNALATTIANADSVLGFVYFYSGDEEKNKVKEMVHRGFLEERVDRWSMEVSFARRNLNTLQPSVPGLISSALRQACFWAHMHLTQKRQVPVDIFAYIDPRNLAARRTLESAGFVKRGMMKYDAESWQEDELYVLDWQILSGKMRSSLE